MGSAFLTPSLSSLLKCYNLGYLPGSGNKSITTVTEDTLASLNAVVGEGGILAPQGCLSVMCYTGHEEGIRETAAVIDHLTQLDKKLWRVFLHDCINRPGTPQLVTALRI